MSNCKDMPRVAVVGAGIYGCTIALHLEKAGFHVDLYDQIGVLMAASSINQFRIHAGYHYPRSPETIVEVLESRNDFISEYQDSIISCGKHYYGMPKFGSRISRSDYIRVIRSFGLSLREVSPSWIDFTFIDTCWEVDEQLYDSSRLREIIKDRLISSNVRFLQQYFEKSQDEQNYDNVIYATYGGSASWAAMFKKVRIEIAEKILVDLPSNLKQKSLVIVDGPFTAFDHYGSAGASQFGSAKYTNHWQTNDPNEPIPDRYSDILNTLQYEKVEFSNFEKMVAEASLAVPTASDARYIGSKFTIRMVEDAPATDQRLLYVHKENSKSYHVFSGKVVGAVKAAKLLVKELGECHEFVS
jgi:FAD dependent oxidoreductase